MAWRGSRARGVFRALACIVFSSERPCLRSPVAAVRQALVRMLTWPIISAGKSNRPTFMAKAIANYGRDCALQRFAPQQTRHHRHLALDRIALRSGIDARGGACASYGRALRRPSGFSPASIVISKPPVAVQLP